MPKLRSMMRSMLPVLFLLATLVLLLWALYALGWESQPRANGAFATATITAANTQGVIYVTQAHDDRRGVLVVYGLKEMTRPPEDTPFGLATGTGTTKQTAEATRIDVVSGAATTTRLENPYDRERFARYEDVPVLDQANTAAYEEARATLPDLSIRFRGVRIPRPRLILFNILGDGAGTVKFDDDALTGRERLVRTRSGETLLTRTLINGRGFRESHRSNLGTFQSADGSLLVCLYSTNSGTTVWLFHNDTAHTQEKR
jgi:hypothetical protein